MCSTEPQDRFILREKRRGGLLSFQLPSIRIDARALLMLASRIVTRAVRPCGPKQLRGVVVVATVAGEWVAASSSGRGARASLGLSPSVRSARMMSSLSVVKASMSLDDDDGAAGTSPAGASPRRVAVIGAGISGLTAASKLAAAGCAVTVLETGRGVGGGALHGRSMFLWYYDTE